MLAPGKREYYCICSLIWTQFLTLRGTLPVLLQMDTLQRVRGPRMLSWSWVTNQMGRIVWTFQSHTKQLPFSVAHMYSLQADISERRNSVFHFVMYRPFLLKHNFPFLHTCLLRHAPPQGLWGSLFPGPRPPRGKYRGIPVPKIPLL